MADILIYGKPTCPHTKRALDAYPDATFIDVIADEAKLAEMLTLSNGQRRVPVIVQNGEASVGYNGGS